MDRVVIVGASLAGFRAAEELRERGFAGSITMVGAEPHRPYDRPPLSKQVLSGKQPPEATALSPAMGEVDDLDLLADDEGGGLVIRIGGTGADAADEAAAAVHESAVPVLAFGQEGRDRAARLFRVLQDSERIAAHDAAADIAVAVAGAGAAVGDVTHDRAGIAADLFRHLLLARIVRLEALGEFAHENCLFPPP